MKQISGPRASSGKSPRWRYRSLAMTTFFLLMLGAAPFRLSIAGDPATQTDTCRMLKSKM